MPAGYEARAAYVREADLYTRTWPSVDPAVPTEILPLLAESIGPEVGSLSVSTVDDKNQSSFPVIATEGGAGELLLECRYSGLEFLFAAALGFSAPRISGVVIPESLGGGAYRHLIEIDSRLHGETWLAGEGWIANDPELIAGLQKLRRGTYVCDKAIRLWETKSAVPLGLVLNGNANSIVSVSTSFIGYQTTLGSHADTDLSGLSCTTPRVSYNDLTLRATTLDNAPLTDDHIVDDITGFNISLNNNLRSILTRDTGKFPDEPARGSPAAIGGAFALPTYTASNEAFSFLYQEGDELVMMFEFVGDEIGASGENYTLRVYLPSVKITGVSIEVGGPSQLQQNYQFTCAKPASTPSGFPDNIKNGSMMIELINDVDQHPLIT